MLIVNSKLYKIGQKYYHNTRAKRNKNIVDKVILLIIKIFNDIIMLRKNPIGAIVLYLLQNNKNKTISTIYIAVRNKFEPVNYISYHNLVDWTLELAHTKIDRDYDAVVAIPRAGLLVGAIIATEHNKPLSTPDMIIENKLWYPNRLHDNTHIERKNLKIKKLLIVDDTMSSGNTYRPIKEMLEKAGFELKTCSLINTVFKPDYSMGYLMPHTPEWDFPDQRGFIEKIAVDLDGILCQECPIEIDNNEEQYIEWIKSVKPLAIPRYKIDFIISNRLEKYRTETEIWLKNNNVVYNKLYLWNLEDKSQRDRQWISHKIDILLKEKPTIMYESEEWQAEQIQKLTGIATICPWRKYVPTR